MTISLSQLISIATDSLRRATKITEIPTMECLAYGKVNLAYLGGGEMEETDIYDLPKDWVYVKCYFMWYTHIECSFCALYTVY